METITDLAIFLKDIAAKKDYPKGLRLNLISNQLGTEGAKALAIALQSGQCPQGLQLNLSDNDLGAEGEIILEQAWVVYYSHQQDNFINCMTLYQGCTQINSMVNTLPPEMLAEICRHVLPATPILAKMTEISAKAFQEQLAMLKLAGTSEYTKQFDKDLEIALSFKSLIKKAAKIKTAIKDFLPKEAETIETKKYIQFSTVALLRKFHLFAEEVCALSPSFTHLTAADKGQVSIEKMLQKK